MQDTISLPFAVRTTSVLAPLFPDTLITPPQTSASCIQGNYCSLVSIPEFQKGYSLSVFPNPASGSATFQFEKITGKETIRLFDALGREVWNSPVDNEEIVLQTREYPAGIYFCRLEKEGELKAVGKLVIR